MRQGSGASEFIRDDGSRLEVIEGFRRSVLGSRQPTSPRADWTEAVYAAAATRKRRRAAKLLESFRHWSGSLDGVALLDVGCGDGSNCLVLGQQPARMLVGVDLDLPMFSNSARGEQTRSLAARIVQAPMSRSDGRLRFAQMNATLLGFTDGAFDALMSRSAMEHIRPIDVALREMVRVVRDGGLIHLSIDPYYWVRGCHKRGIVDIPWAHARLTLAEYSRFVVSREGEEVATERCRRLETLNRFTVTEWRLLIDQMGCEVLEWRESHSALGEHLLARYPEVLETLLPGVTLGDLLCERIKVWLRKAPRAHRDATAAAPVSH
jgi:ubiquinone/menaquinone biosynthesis C-methylase UbiE